MLIETADDVIGAMTEIRAYPGKIAFGEAMGTVETVRNAFMSAGMASFNYRLMFLKIGKFADDWLEDTIATRNTPAFCELLLKKNRAYGDLPIRRWGPLGIIIRLDSKLTRMHTLLRQPEVDPIGEATHDTATDILGYSVLGLRLLKESH